MPMYMQENANINTCLSGCPRHRRAKIIFNRVFDWRSSDVHEQAAAPGGES